MNQITRVEILSEEAFWPDERARFTGDCLDALFAWAFRKNASDIRLQTHEPARIQIHGRLQQVTRRALTESEIEEAVNLGDEALAVGSRFRGRILHASVHGAP